jgi:hypothetical protein
MSMLPSDTPRLPKWPFLVGDAVLLAGAVLLATRSPVPYATPVILTIALCVALASILGVIPFLADYAHRQDETLDERQRSLEALTRTVADSAEQISVAATSLHELSAASRQPQTAAETVPSAQLEAQLTALGEQQARGLAQTSDALRQELKTLRNSVREQITALKSILPVSPPPTAAPALVTQPQPIESPAPAIEPATPEKPSIVETPPPVPEPNPAVPPEPASESANPTPVEAEPTPIKKAPAAKKTKVSEPAADEPTPQKPAESTGELTLSNDDPAPDFPVRSNQRMASDGATRLLVTAYIGIGNRLFIRGEGAGLSPDKGVPLQFVSIGKWQWETKEATGPVRARLYKNDEIECVSLGEITLESGHQAEVSASF